MVVSRVATGTAGFMMALTVPLACHPPAHSLTAPDGAHQIRVDDVLDILSSGPGEEGVLGDSCCIDENVDVVLGTVSYTVRRVGGAGRVPGT